MFWKKKLVRDSIMLLIQNLIFHLSKQEEIIDGEEMVKVIC